MKWLRDIIELRREHKKRTIERIKFAKWLDGLP
jgi:hypothetical protein